MHTANDTTFCARCSTEIGPSRIYCTPCKVERIDTALALRKRCMDLGKDGYIEALDRQLKLAQVNIRPDAKMKGK